MHLTFLDANCQDNKYVGYSHASGWGNEKTIHSKPPNVQNQCVLSINGKVLYCFFLEKLSGTNIVLVKRCLEGVWETEPIRIRVESAPFTAFDKLGCYDKAYNGEVCCYYMTGSSSPYAVRSVICAPVVCIILVRNMESTIGGIVREAFKHCDVVLVADDNSEDATRDVSQKSGATVIRRVSRFGGVSFQPLLGLLLERGSMRL